MASRDPMTMKKLGRRVRNFNEQTWLKESQKIVKCGNVAKFSQNSKLNEQLLATYPKVLVEASPYDRIWGIGRSTDDPNIHDVKKWRGLNQLGNILTQIRHSYVGK